MSNKTILVADDESHILNVVSLKLRNAGFRVVTLRSITSSSFFDSAAVTRTLANGSN